MTAIKPRSRLSYANVVSTLALVLVLGGGSAYAANTIGSRDIIDGSIKSADLKDGKIKSVDIGADQVTGALIEPGAVLGPDLGSNAVDGSKVLDGTITTADLAGDAVTSAKVTDNSIGLADLVGTDVTTLVTVAAGFIPTGHCTNFQVTAGGAVAGQSVVVSTDAGLEDGVVIHAQGAMLNGHVLVDICNFTGHAMDDFTDLPLRIVTFG
jgi:hypothetical protein